MPTSQPPVKTIALVAMPGVQLLDLAGASDVFTCANNLLAADSVSTIRPYTCVTDRDQSAAPNDECWHYAAGYGRRSTVARGGAHPISGWVAAGNGRSAADRFLYLVSYDDRCGAADGVGVRRGVCACESGHSSWSARHHVLGVLSPAPPGAVSGRAGGAGAILCARRARVLIGRYPEGIEDQLGVLGLVVNALVLWNTRYLQ